MINFTTKQQQAIDYDQAKPLLVSAAAGSGKTAVLINRIYKRLIDKKVEPENLLVMTFTKKAATQMRQKLEEKLAEEMANTSDPKFLEQLRNLKKRLPLAKISTIHAFCLSMIKEYNAYLVDDQGELILDAQVNNISDTQRTIYLERAIDDVLNYLYQKLADLEDQENYEKDKVVSQELPGLSQEMSLFNIMQEPVTQEAWLNDFENLTFAFTESYTDQQMRTHISQMLSQAKSLPYYENALITAFEKYQRNSENLSESDFVKETLTLLEEKIETALLTIMQVKNTNYYRNASQGKIKSKEAKTLQEKLETEENVISSIAQILKTDQNNEKKWQSISQAAAKLGEPIALRKTSANTKAAIEKREFYETYEPNVLPIIAVLNKNFNVNSSVAERNNLIDSQPYFSQNLKFYEKSLQIMNKPLARFIEIIILCDQRFQQIKRRYNLIDFNDYEHFTLQLLDQKEIAESVHAQFQEIYIDEYQDTNPIQELIVSRIKSDKVFMVGDLKQSIYRFRHADPNLFKTKLDQYSEYQAAEKNSQQESVTETNSSLKEPLSGGHYILLNKNFRSSETILEGINQLFTSFMKEEVAEIEYDDSQKLIPGNENLFESEVGKKRITFKSVFIPENNQKTNQQVLEEQDEETASPEERLNSLINLEQIEINSNNDLKLAYEALNAVYLIRKNILQGKNYDDFAILARTHNICNIYSQVLTSFNIPVNSTAEKNYLDSLELRFLIQLIHLLDNAKQDIPLVAVMRSNIFGLAFDEDELLICRLFDPNSKFFHQIIETIGSMEKADFIDEASCILEADSKAKIGQLYDKINQFLNLISELREKANWLSLSELLDEIFQIADYPSQVANLPFAKQRLADIEKFQEWANQFEQDQGSGLHNFTNYLQKIKERKLQVQDFDEAPVVDNSVSVMTIHASKGLQYKHIILAGSNQKLLRNRSDSIFQFDPEFGFATYTTDTHEQIIYSNLSMLEFNKTKTKKLWAEEYRLLYVAMTRAEEDLTILANLSSGKRNEILANLIPKLNQKIDQDDLYTLDSYAEIIMSFLTNQAKKENNTQNILDYFVLNNVPDSKLQIELENYNVNFITVAETISKLENQQKTWQQEAEKSIDVSSEQERTIVAKNLSKQEKAEQDLTAILLPEEVGKQEINRLTNLLAEIEDPFAESPAKITVTELKRAQTQALDTENFEKNILPKGMADMGFVLRKPQLEQEETQISKSGVEFGTFIHALMHFIDLQDYLTKPKAEWSKIYDRQIDRLIGEKKIRSHEKELAEYSYQFIEKFLDSDLAQRIVVAEQEHGLVYRETPFTLSIPPLGNEGIKSKPNEDLLETTTDKFDGDQTLLQGMIDLWFMEDGEAVLVDYKSDFILEKDKLPILQERYETQLNYYALAIERILDLPNTVKEKCMWLLRDGKAYYL